MTDLINVYEDLIISNDIGTVSSEQLTNELKFIDGKLHQKVLLNDYSNGIVSFRWDEIEGQEDV